MGGKTSRWKECCHVTRRGNYIRPTTDGFCTLFIIQAILYFPTQRQPNYKSTSALAIGFSFLLYIVLLIILIRQIPDIPFKHSQPFLQPRDLYLLVQRHGHFLRSNQSRTESEDAVQIKATLIGKSMPTTGASMSKAAAQIIVENVMNLVNSP